MRSAHLYITLLCLMVATAVGAETRSVITRDNTIRSDCRFFAPVKSKVKYGDKLTITGKKGDWYLVSFRAAAGCIHKSALDSRSFAVTGNKSTSGGVSANEVSLAGKGFNPQTEAGYRTANRDVDFKVVDEIELLTVSDTALEVFIRQGGLVQP